MIKAHKCERCDYDDVADPPAPVPDFFQNHYQYICDGCAADLLRKQAKIEMEMGL